MQTPSTSAITSPVASKLPWRQWLRLVLLVSFIWAAIGVVGALATYSDLLRRGAEIAFLEVVWAWWRGSIPLALMSGLGYAAFQRWPQLSSNAKAMSLGFALVLFVFFPMEQIYQVILQLQDEGAPLSLSAIGQTLTAMPKRYWFTDVVIMSGAYATLLVITNWQWRRIRDRALLQAEKDNLRLRLQLEQQTLNSLRAQLEPHFLFNALNAISALVRASERAVALSALQRLSELLRYALAAGQKKWVCVADELKFIGDYLALQQLRYGDRLQIRLEGIDHDISAIDCPPLLLQPLVENALRHDLDCHEGNGDIAVRFSLQEGWLVIDISNPVSIERPPNPGLGLGLRNTRERLLLLYGNRATLATEIVGGRFVVTLRLPHDGEV